MSIVNSYHLEDRYDIPTLGLYQSLYNEIPSRYEGEFTLDIHKITDRIMSLGEKEFYVDKWRKRKYDSKNYLDRVLFTFKDKPRLLILLDFSISSIKDNGEEISEDYMDDDDVNVLLNDPNLTTVANTDIHLYYDTKLYDIDKIEKIVNDIIKDCEIIQTDKHFIDLIYSSNNGLSTKSFKIEDVEIDLDLNYNEGFRDKHKFLLHQLSTTSKGVAILHGYQGTGKTMYIRHLISKLSKSHKRVIYMPSSMVEQLSSPAFIPLLAENANSILVIEDAENAVQSRDTGHTAVANLLNLADGLLSDALSIQMIVTFNMNISNIDKALLREGRLILKHEFDKLTPEKSTALSKKLGIGKTYTKAASLAEIYNEHQEYKHKEIKRKIGF